LANLESRAGFVPGIAFAFVFALKDRVGENLNRRTPEGGTFSALRSRHASFEENAQSAP
jgi:hypothetical protein